MKLETISLSITGMTCDHCAIGIEKMVSTIGGFSNATVDYVKGSGEFSFDPVQTSANAIIAAINGSKHYKAAISDSPAERTSTHSHFNLIIIGGGSAAFSAAIRAEELGLKTLMINGGLDFGGTCVNVGCVPSKTLIRAAEAAFHATHSNFAGISPKGVTIDFPQVIQDKKRLVAELQKHKYLDIVSDFEHLQMRSGWAEFTDEHTVTVDRKDRFTADQFLIATGATTFVPAIGGLNEIGYLTSASLFDLEQKPDQITILGAGYIGLEIAMAYNRLGVKVRLIEVAGRVLASQAPDISEVLESQMKQEGIELLLGFEVVKFDRENGAWRMHCKKQDGSLVVLDEIGKIVLATGTKPNTDKLGLANIGLALDAQGRILVDATMATNIQHVRAAGDVTNMPSFVYTAALEGKVAVGNAFGDVQRVVDFTALPWVVFTDPQVAGAGMDETQAALHNIPYEVSKLEVSQVPRAIAAMDTRGFVKLIRNPETDMLIGARVVAPEGGELIELLSMSIKHGISVTALAEGFYPYLTLSEGIKLAAIAFGKDVSKLSCCAS